jgi:hypothetical protein
MLDDWQVERLTTALAKSAPITAAGVCHASSGPKPLRLVAISGGGKVIRWECMHQPPHCYDYHSGLQLTQC